MFDPQSKFAGHCRNFVDTDTLRNLVVIAIARLLKALVQVHIAVTAALPAMETGAVDFDETGAADCFLGSNHAVFEGGERRYHLKR